MSWQRKGKARQSVVVMGCVAFALASSARSGEIDGKEDFGQIAREGFEELVDGAFVAGDGSYPNLVPHPDGSKQNSYPWSMVYQDGKLWVGTVRNLRCFLNPGSGPPGTCPEPPPGGIFPLPRYTDDAAQAWRYMPGGVGGLDGTWEKLDFEAPRSILDPSDVGRWGQSPPVPVELRCALNSAGIPEALACIQAGGTGPEYPRHIGLRTAISCDAGGLDTVYFNNLGLPAAVVHWDETVGALVPSSSTGDTFTSLLDLSSGTVDLGYRGFACFDFPDPPDPPNPQTYTTKLCTAPSGSFQDTDTTIHPWVICNEDPSNQTPGATDSEWVAHSGLFPTGNPLVNNGFFPGSDDIGIFDMQTVDNDADPETDWLCVGAMDRTNGASVYCTDGTGCPACVWTEVVAGGMGRPEQALILQSGGGIAIFDAGGPGVNAAAFGMGTFDDDGDGKAEYLYFGMADAAGGINANNLLAEMGRIDFDPLSPTYLKWELIAGLARVLAPCAAGFGVNTFVPPPEMSCTPASLPGVFPIPCACLPQAQRGLGMAQLAPPFSAYSSLFVGPASYIWRFAQHEGDLFVGILDLLQVFDAPGFNIYKSSDGTSFATVDTTGLGTGASNYGVRGVVSTDATPGVDDPGPDSMLFVGAANPFTTRPDGGLQVFLGTLEPELPPVAVAEFDELLFDDELCAGPESCPPGDGLVETVLDGTGSADPFGGTLVGHEWRAGDLVADCDMLVSPPLATTPTYDPGQLAVGFPTTEYPFTLRVEDDVGTYGCDLVTTTASGNLQPLSIIETVPPLIDSAMRLVDFDGDGQESFHIEGRCFDPEGALVSCDWTSIDGGLTFGPAATSPAPVYAGTVSALIQEDAGSLFGDSTPDIRLRATDSVGYQVTRRIDARVRSFVDTTGENDRPDCQAGVVYTRRDTSVTFAPLDPAGTTRLCGDADAGDTLTVALIDPAPARGEVTTDGTEITYTPDPGVTGLDSFALEATDDAVEPSTSNAVPVLVKIVECALGDVEKVIDGVTYAAGPAVEESACVKITSVNATTVQTGADVDFLAGKSVTIGDGFVAEGGSSFTVRLLPELAETDGLALTKTADPTSVTTAGEVITYTYTLVNSGTGNLTGVTLVDVSTGSGTDPVPVLMSGDGDLDSILDLGESWTYEGSYTLTAADCLAGVDLENTATADSDQTETVAVTVAVTVACP